MADEVMPPDNPEILELPELPRRFGLVGLDIETFGLNSDFGVILVICLKPLGEKIDIFRLDDYKNWQARKDYQLLVDVSDYLNQCTNVFGWNSTRYDVAWLRGRRLALGLAKNPVAFRHSDLMVQGRKLAFHNARLETLMQMLSHEEKHDVRPSRWLDALLGERSAMDEIVKHCVNDVEGMEDVYQYLGHQIATWTQVVI